MLFIRAKRDDDWTFGLPLEPPNLTATLGSKVDAGAPEPLTLAAGEAVAGFSAVDDMLATQSSDNDGDQGGGGMESPSSKHGQ